MNTIAQPAHPGTWNFIPMLLALILASPAGTWPGGGWETQHWGVFSKTWAWFLLSLAPGFSPVIRGRQAASAPSAASSKPNKPLKRLWLTRPDHTGLKPAANEIANLNSNDILETRPKVLDHCLSTRREKRAGQNSIDSGGLA